MAIPQVPYGVSADAARPGLNSASGSAVLPEGPGQVAGVGRVEVLPVLLAYTVRWHGVCPDVTQ